MKTLKIKLNKTLSLLGALMLATLTSFSAPHVTMILKNIATTNNTISYDLCIVNDGTTGLRLGACSYGIDFSHEILNGGSVKFRLLPGTLNKVFSAWSPFSFNTKKVGEQNEVRMTSIAHDPAIGVELTPQQVVLIGRFEMKNSQAWTVNSRANLVMNELTRVGFTTTQVLAYIDNAQVNTALTPKAQTVTCVVEECPVLNPSAIQVNTNGKSMPKLSSLTEIRCFPNPVLDNVTLSIKASKAGEAMITLVDMTGSVIREKSATCIEGFNEIEISCNDLASGNYILSVRDVDQVAYTQRISKK